MDGPRCHGIPQPLHLRLHGGVFARLRRVRCGADLRSAGQPADSAAIGSADPVADRFHHGAAADDPGLPQLRLVRDPSAVRRLGRRCAAGRMAAGDIARHPDEMDRLDSGADRRRGTGERLPPDPADAAAGHGRRRRCGGRRQRRGLSGRAAGDRLLGQQQHDLAGANADEHPRLFRPHRVYLRRHAFLVRPVHRGTADHGGAAGAGLCTGGLRWQPQLRLRVGEAVPDLRPLPLRRRRGDGHAGLEPVMRGYSRFRWMRGMMDSCRKP